MQLVRPATNESWWILNQIFPGRADSLMRQTPQDRMEAVASYLAQQIKVKIIIYRIYLDIIVIKYFKFINYLFFILFLR